MNFLTEHINGGHAGQIHLSVGATLFRKTCITRRLTCWLDPIYSPSLLQERNGLVILTESLS